MGDDEFDLIMEATIQVCLALQQDGSGPSSVDRIREIAKRLDESADRLTEQAGEHSNGLAKGFTDLLRRTYGTANR